MKDIKGLLKLRPSFDKESGLAGSINWLKMSLKTILFPKLQQQKKILNYSKCIRYLVDPGGKYLLVAIEEYRHFPEI